MKKLASLKRRVHKALSDPDSKYFFVISDILAFFTIVSIVSIVLETVPSLSPYKTIFSIVEWTTVAVFTAEYLARVFVVVDKNKYVFSWFGAVDLISIVPSYLGLANLTFLKSARTIRLLRLLRLLRIARMRNVNAKDLDERMSYYTINILIFLVTLVGSMLAIGILIYLVEGNTPAFRSIPHGMLWSFMLFLDSNTVQYPTSTGGEIVYALAKLVGLTVFGVLIGVVGNVLQDSIFGKQKAK